jgi:hypothetical protein
MTVSPGAADAATAEVLAQHEHLRALLRMVDGEAERVVRAETHPRSELPRVFALFARALSVHLDCEDELLAESGGVAPTRARPVLARVCDEHARQRDEMLRLSRRALGADDRITLALEIRAFVSDVFLDMDIEDRAFLGPRAAAVAQ